MDFWLKMILAAAVAFGISFAMTPPVKGFAEQVGAIDVPKEARRVHDHPIPRMGGLAIFLGFMLTALLFVQLNTQVTGILIGAIIIAVMGAVDDIVSLNAWIKLAGQIVAAVVAIRCGVVFSYITNPNFLSGITTISIGWLSVPLTLLWIIACTNAMNLIDGLDGLAVGVASISALTMLVVSLIVSEPTVSLLLAALTGACLGFMPFNLNPAKIFMGDVGRGHLHHRLLALGMSQKQVVAVMYGVSAVLGLIAVLLTGKSPILRVVCLALAFAVSIAVWLYVFRKNPNLRLPHHGEEEKTQ